MGNQREIGRGQKRIKEGNQCGNKHGNKQGKKTWK